MLAIAARHRSSSRTTLFSVPAQPRRGAFFAPLTLPKRTRRPASISVPVAKPAIRNPLPFRNFPPAPKRTARPLPPGLLVLRQWIDERWAQGHGRTTAGLFLLFLLPQMQVDSVLYSRDWRLELVWTGKKGYPYYILYWRSYILGTVDVPILWGQSIQSCPDLPLIHRQLAAYLVCCGFTRANSVLVEGLARTPVNASKRAFHRLFEGEKA